MATREFKFIAAALALSLALVAGVAAQGFGTSGVSSRELPAGICVVEIDEVIVDDSEEFLDLVITETGRKPAFAKVQSLWFYAENEDGSVLGEGQDVQWDFKVRTMSRTLTGISTGVPDKTAFFLAPEGGGDKRVLHLGQSAVDLVTNQFAMQSNGIPIASQGTAGEIRLGLMAANFGELTYDLHITAVIESPSGSLCSINLVPTESECGDNFCTEEESEGCEVDACACVEDCGRTI